MSHTTDIISPAFGPSPVFSALSGPEKQPSLTSDCASDSSTTESQPQTTRSRHLKVKITLRRRLFKLKTTQLRGHLRLIQSIESLLQQQAPETPHSTVLTAMPIDQKRKLLEEIRKRVTVIEETMSKASAALPLLLQYM